MALRNERSVDRAVQNADLVEFEGFPGGGLRESGTHQCLQSGASVRKCAALPTVHFGDAENPGDGSVLLAREWAACAPVPHQVGGILQGRQGKGPEATWE